MKDTGDKGNVRCFACGVEGREIWQVSASGRDDRKRMRAEVGKSGKVGGGKADTITCPRLQNSGELQTWFFKRSESLLG